MLRLTGLVVLVLVALVSPASGRDARRCESPPRARVAARSTAVVVWVRNTARRYRAPSAGGPTGGGVRLTGHTYDACAPENGRRTHLTSVYNTPRSQADTPGAPYLFRLRVRGRAVAYGRYRYDGLITVVDSRTGEREVTRIAAPPTRYAFFELYRLALGPGFSVAWHGVDEHNDPAQDQVGVIDGGGSRVVDSAGFRSIEHFRVRDSVVSWTNGGAPRMLTLQPRQLRSSR